MKRRFRLEGERAAPLRRRGTGRRTVPGAPATLTAAALALAALMPRAVSASPVQARIEPPGSTSARVSKVIVASVIGPGGAMVRAAPVTSMSMTSQLADNLALLFEKFAETEFILCIEGEVDAGGQLVLRDFRMPHMAYSRSTGAGVRPDGECAQYEDIIGTVHSHPPTYPSDRGREWNNCYLSRPDIQSWLNGSDYPYTLVMCGPRTWAWWHRSQVDPARVLAFPPPGQLVGRTAGTRR